MSICLHAKDEERFNIICMTIAIGILQVHSVEETRASRARARIRVLYERDVIAFEHNASEGLANLRLDVILLGVIQDEVHILVEADDVALDAQVDVLK